MGKGASPRRFRAQGSHKEPSTPQNLDNDAISRALQQISHSSFSEEIESTDLPWRFFKLIFVNYDGKSLPIEHINHYNQSMTISSKNEALICKMFPSSLGSTTMRRFNGLEKGSIYRYDELTREFGARFVTCSRVPKPFDSLIIMSMKEGETLKAYFDHYYELYNMIEGNNGGVAVSTFKVGLIIDFELRTSLTL